VKLARLRRSKSYVLPPMQTFPKKNCSNICLVSISGISLSNHKLGDQSLLVFWGKSLRVPCLHGATRELSPWSAIRRLRGLVDFVPSGSNYCSCCHQSMASPNTAGAAFVGSWWFCWCWRGKPERWGSVWQVRFPVSCPRELYMWSCESEYEASMET
jgi:hypothetical protein